MNKLKYVFVLLFLCCLGICKSQVVELSGKVVAEDDLEGIHVINKTASKFTITDLRGDFVIPAKLHDTLVFSAITYKSKVVIVSQEMIMTTSISVALSEFVNVLDEVIVGKVLTGNLASDIANSDANRDLDFYDVGIPGYKGLPATQSQQRLNDADHGKMINYYGLFATVNINKLLNKISGRTKELKRRVDIETRETCLQHIISDLSETFFATHELEETRRTDFFYHCMEDPEFSNLCAINNDFNTFEFLKKKWQSYTANLELKKE